MKGCRKGGKNHQNRTLKNLKKTVFKWRTLYNVFICFNKTQKNFQLCSMRFWNFFQFQNIFSLPFSIFEKHLLIHIISALLALFTVKLLYSFIFPKVKSVQCWFCHEKSFIAKAKLNNWACVNCGQYNGFKDDGDYNMEIPEQHYGHMNTKVYAHRKIDESEMVMCDYCNESQAKKVSILNRVKPMDENNYFTEYAELKSKLERHYPLCFVCENRVASRLKSINDVVLPQYMKWSSERNRDNRLKKYKFCSMIQHLNVLQFSITLMCFVLQFVFKIQTQFIFNQQQNFPSTESYISISSFVAICAITIFGNVRPSLKLGLTRISALFLLLNFDILVDMFINDVNPILWHFARLLCPVWIIYTSLMYCCNFIAVLRAYNSGKKCTINTTENSKGPAKSFVSLNNNRLPTIANSHSKSAIHSNVTFPSTQPMANHINACQNCCCEGS